VWYGIPVTGWACLAPLALLLLIVFGMSIGLVLAPLNLFYEDISASLAAITTFWLFLTPVIVPTPTEGWASIVVRYNPVTPLLATTRELATLGNVSSPIGFGIMAAVTVALFLFGCIFFRSTLPLVVDQANL
jgi:lipopolysaccharide transport system permease protein